jgi:hypothetical protein
MNGNNLLYFGIEGKSVSIQVYDATGDVVLEKENWNTSEALDLSDLNGGVYFISTSSDSEITTHKIVR